MPGARIPADTPDATHTFRYQFFVQLLAMIPGDGDPNAFDTNYIVSSIF